MEKLERNLIVAQSPPLSVGSHPRYVIADADTGEIIDDAQGYGYKTKRQALANCKPEKKQKNTHKLINDWLRTHPDMVNAMDAEAYYIRRNVNGEFGERTIREIFRNHGIAEDYLPFSYHELTNFYLKYWEG